MRIAVLQERAAGESRVAATPETVRKFIALGATVAVERGAGEGASIPDSTFEEAGAELGLAQDAIEGADIVLAVRAPAAAALKGARSIISQEVQQGRLDLDGHIEVVDGEGRSVLTLSFREAAGLQG